MGEIVKLKPDELIKIVENKVNPIDSEFALTVLINSYCVDDVEITKVVGDVNIIELGSDEVVIGNECIKRRLITAFPKTVPAIILFRNLMKRDGRLERILEVYSFGDDGWNDERLIVKLDNYEVREVINTFGFTEVSNIDGRIVKMFREDDNPIDRVLVLTILLRGESEVKRILGDVDVLTLGRDYDTDKLRYELIAVIPKTVPAIIAVKTLDIVNPLEPVELAKYLEIFTFEDCPGWSKTKILID